MKKLIIKALSLSLAFILILLTLISCNPTTDQGEQNGGNNNDGSSDEQNGGSKEEGDSTFNPESVGELISSESKLIIELTAFCKTIMADIDPAPRTTEDKIDAVKNGAWPIPMGNSASDSNYLRPVLMDYSESTPYYVCAYYDFEHDVEYAFYCCAADYTWVKYENEEDIADYYNDEKFLISFRVNEASYVKDIISDDTNITCAKHFQVHRMFHGVTMPDDFKRTFILLDDSNETEIYYTTEAYNHKISSFPCIYLDGEYFILVCLYSSMDAAEGITNNDIEYLKYDFGKYYDDMMSIMIFDRYTVALPSGKTEFYGLIDIDEFVNEILKEKK